jgi:hypothetical protein
MATVRKKARAIIVICNSCGSKNRFSQPWAYHAGFSNQGFLYNDDGNLTLIWSSFDPAFESIVGDKHPWALSPADRKALEASLKIAPHGGRWRFANPPRCTQCGQPLGESILETIYYLVYPGSINADTKRPSLARFLLSRPRTVSPRKHRRNQGGRHQRLTPALDP